MGLFTSRTFNSYTFSIQSVVQITLYLGILIKINDYSKLLNLKMLVDEIVTKE